MIMMSHTRVLDRSNAAESAECTSAKCRIMWHMLKLLPPVVTLTLRAGKAVSKCRMLPSVAGAPSGTCRAICGCFRTSIVSTGMPAATAAAVKFLGWPSGAGVEAPPDANAIAAARCTVWRPCAATAGAASTLAAAAAVSGVDVSCRRAAIVGVGPATHSSKSSTARHPCIDIMKIDAWCLTLSSPATALTALEKASHHATYCMHSAHAAASRITDSKRFKA